VACGVEVVAEALSGARVQRQVADLAAFAVDAEVGDAAALGDVFDLQQAQLLAS